MIGSHLKTFAGKEIQDFPGPKAIAPQQATRLSVEYDSRVSIEERIREFVNTPGASQLEALVIGQWASEQFDVDSSEVVAELVMHATKLTGLRAIFLGEIIGEECEISWLHQSDVSPLLDAFPKLEVLYVRGGESLSFAKLDHSSLREFVIQTGGLPRTVVQSIGKAKLPALEHLELWLGSDNYGGDTKLDDLAPLLAGNLFPKLKYLGLRDSENTNEIAAAVAKAPVLKQLDTLDLSMGVLGDEGGQALLASPAISHLKTLNLSHHYLSEPLMAQLASLPGVEVDLSEGEGLTDPDDRYISVSE